MAGFDLAGVLKDVSIPNTRREQIVYIPAAVILPDVNNGYSMDGIDELARSIELVGLQQPLRVRKTQGGEYRIISGHRRFAALELLMDRGDFDGDIPCIVESEDGSPAWRELQLLLGNAENRRMTGGDLSRQAERVSDCIRKLEAEGYRFPGRHREWVAKMVGISNSKLARLEAIRNNLTPALIDRFNAGTLGVTAAYRISQESPEVQNEVARIDGAWLEAATADQIEACIGNVKKNRAARGTEPAPKAKADGGPSGTPAPTVSDAELVKAMNPWRRMSGLAYMGSLDELAQQVKITFRHSGYIGPDAVAWSGKQNGVQFDEPMDRLLTWKEIARAMAMECVRERVAKVDGKPKKSGGPSGTPAPTRPEWRTGPAPEKGRYLCRMKPHTEAPPNEFTLTWDGKVWNFMDRPILPGMVVDAWYPLPEEE